MTAAALLGFDIGGTKSAVVLGDATGRIADRRQMPTGDADATIQRMIETGQAMCESANGPLAACGVSVGSPLDRNRGLIMAPANLPMWVDVPVVERLRRAFGAPVNLENDADAAALAEWRWGLNRKYDDVIYLTCGTGQGSGLIIGGRLHRGCSNLAGEIGHVRLLPLGPVGCRKAGSVEGLTSGRALGELAKLRIGEPHAPSPLDDLPVQTIDGKVVGEAAISGDEFAVAVVREVAGHLGRACAIMIDVLNPQRISLGSLVIRLADLMLEPVRAAAEAEAMPGAFHACSIAPAALGERVQDLAALAAACEAMR